MSNSCLKTTLSITSALALATSAFAQDDGNQSSASVLVDEIFVTAQKKSSAEEVQDVPIAISAYSNDLLDALQIDDVTDLSLSAPNVQLTPIGTVAGVANFNIRGSGVVNSIPSVDPAVGVVIDGVPLGTIYGATVDTFDLEGLEILRGPQGTLFGRNVTGGVVNLRSARPGDEFSGKVRAVLGTDGRNDFAIAAGGPISDKVGARVSVQYADKDGWIENAAVGDEQGAANSLLVRPTLTYENGGFDVTATGEIFRGSSDDTPIWSAATGENFGFVTVNREINNNEQEWESVTLEANLDVGPGKLTGVFGYRDLLVNSAAQLGAGTLPSFLFLNDLEQDQTYLELRWAGNITDRLSLTLGGNYFDQFYDYDEERFIETGGANIHFIRGGNIDQSAIGLFAQAQFDVTERLSIIAGGRYSDESKDAELFINGQGRCDPVEPFNSTGDAGPGFLVRGNPESCSAPIISDSWSDFSPKIGANFQVSDDVLLYGSWSQGFRSGGYNLRHEGDIEFASYDPEKLTAYEIGIKSDWFDNRVRLNAALFRNEITDLQATSNLTIGTGDIIQVIANDAEAYIDGLEVEAVFLVTDNFAIDASLGLNSHEYQAWPIVEAQIAAGTANVSRLEDLVIPLSPRTQFHIGAVYDISLPIGDVALRGAYSHTGDTFGNQQNPANSFQPSYDILNASAKLTLDSGLGIKLFGKNITEEVYTPFAFSLGRNLGNPGQYGVELTYDF